MLSFLKNHPFGVEAFFESSTVLTFAVLKEELEPLIPDCLELDVYEGKWGFVAAALVQTHNLRPKGFPSFFGNDFFLIGYRIFIRYRNNKGKNLRGLFIIKSETDKRKMQFFGNIFTHYNYTTTDISYKKNEQQTKIKSLKSDFELTIDNTDIEAILPSNSPFENWQHARRFAGPLPFTFTYNKVNKEVLIIEGVRSNWKPTPINIKNYRFSFIESLGFKTVMLANAFRINNIPYEWKKGKKEKWNH